ncbi:MAG: hypothetical protein OEZ10_11580 [Gammaproteobacteria bacterium]|nr:hypothetical protein [Gammaproteobacteria bacterium]
MTGVALATNARTATKAAIKRGTNAAQVSMRKLDRDALNDLEALYLQTRTEIENVIRSYGDDRGSLRLDTMQQLLGQVNGRLRSLELARDQMLWDGIDQAAKYGAGVYDGIGLASFQVAEEAALFVRNFVAEDGLQLSDRLWRNSNHAREIMGRQIQSAIIQGHNASKAAQEYLAKGITVPTDLADKLGIANAHGVAKVAAGTLMQGDDAPYWQARRVFRTEINRAHGEAYMAGGEQVEGFVGWRFLLSPNHPRVDICDMHASANLYGLGPGVYPNRSACPWPAHPNTLSFVEMVFDDEVTADDRAGKQDRLDWLGSQSASVQTGVLGSQKKQAAFNAGILKQNEIATPWRVLKNRFEKRGIDVAKLMPVPGPPTAIIAKPVAVNIKPNLPTLEPGSPNRRSNEFFDRWDQAGTFNSDTLKKSAARFHAPGEIPKTTGGAYYSNGKIHMAGKHPDTLSGQGTMRHEYGHYLDDKIGLWKESKGEHETTFYRNYISSGRKGTAALEADDVHIRQLQENYFKGAKKRHPSLAKRRFSSGAYNQARSLDVNDFIREHGDVASAAAAARKQLPGGNDIFDLLLKSPDIEITNDHAAILLANGKRYGDTAILCESMFKHPDAGHMADLAGAVTRNRVGWGHSNAYYKQRSGFGRQAEAFANTFCLLDYKAGTYQREYMRTFVPNFSKFVEDILQEVIDG